MKTAAKKTTPKATTKSKTSADKPKKTVSAKPKKAQKRTKKIKAPRKTHDELRREIVDKMLRDPTYIVFPRQRGRVSILAPDTKTKPSKAQIAAMKARGDWP